MIKLNKLAKPKRLVDKAKDWTDNLLTKKRSNIEPTSNDKSHYRHPEIKAVLVDETNGKCAYCESKLQHIHHGDVEHIYPKSLDISLTFEWNNLTLACEVCNQFKSNKDPYAESIIDPYITDPENHFIFVGGMIFSSGSVLGTSTRSILKLHRAELVEMRNSQMEKIMLIFQQIQDSSLPLVVRKDLYKDLLASEASPKAPYSAMAKSLIRNLSEKIDPKVIV